MNERCGAPTQIKDPDDPTRTISDLHEIKTKLGQYWGSLGAKRATEENSAIHAKLNHYEKLDSSNDLHNISVIESNVGAAINNLKNNLLCFRPYPQ